MKTFHAVGAVTLAALVAFALLVAGRAGGTSAPGVATAPAAAAVALTVTAAVAQSTPWPMTLDATGAIAPWQEASVGTQLGGLLLREVNANVGDLVRRGQVLARFDTQMLEADDALLRANLRQAEAAAAQTEANRLRALQLQGGGGISAQDVLQAVTAADTAKAQVAAVHAQLAAKRLQMDQAAVTAPDDGVISARSATVGAVAPSGQELFRLIRKNRLEWRGELTAAQLASVSTGQVIALSLPDGTAAVAHVRQTAPTLDAATRLGTVFADIALGSAARAGMYARGRFALSERPAVVVPAASVVIRDGRSYVFGLQAPEKPEKAAEKAVDADTARVVLLPVTVGRRQGGQVEIVQGLAAGGRVVVQGAGFLNDGDAVRIAPPSATAAKGTTPRPRT
jgi:RND family efflux transporter MFP subunit